MQNRIGAYLQANIWKRVLGSLDCDNMKMLMAAKDKNGNNNDVTKRLREDRNETKKTQEVKHHYMESPFL